MTSHVGLRDVLTTLNGVQSEGKAACNASSKHILEQRLDKDRSKDGRGRYACLTGSLSRTTMPCVLVPGVSEMDFGQMRQAESSPITSIRLSGDPSETGKGRFA